MNAKGTHIVQEAEFYTIQYYDEHGKRIKVPTRCADKHAARELANSYEADMARRKRGLIDTAQERMLAEAQRPLQEHLADFRATLEAAGRTENHVGKTHNLIRSVIDAASIGTLRDITADRVSVHAASLLSQGKSARTVQATLTAMKTFSRWLTRHGRLPADPLAATAKPNPKAAIPGQRKTPSKLGVGKSHFRAVWQ